MLPWDYRYAQNYQSTLKKYVIGPNAIIKLYSFAKKKLKMFRYKVYENLNEQNKEYK
jgi:hypothetical protein